MGVSRPIPHAPIRGISHSSLARSDSQDLAAEIQMLFCMESADYESGTNLGRLVSDGLLYTYFSKRIMSH